MNKFFQGCLVFSVFLVLSGNRAGAQIPVISATDVEGQYAADTTRRYFDTTSVRLLNIGETGATSWDFSQLRQDSSWSISNVQPVTTPYAADFPVATHGQQSTLTLSNVLPGVNATGTAYQFYKLDTLFVDFGIKGTGTVGGMITGTIIWTKLPGDTLYKLPMTLGTQWGSTDSAITIIDVSPLYFSRTAKWESWDVIVDAYGPMTLPDMTVHQALRIKKVTRTGSGTASYMFVARDGAFVNFTTVDTGAPVTGEINVKGITWGPAMFNPPVSVESTPKVPQEFSLAQNYPNPFNPSTVIRYGLSEQSRVRLEIFNVIGQQVATLVDANQQAGYHEVQFNGSSLPSGLYFYRLTAGGFVQTLKMMLTK